MKEEFVPRKEKVYSLSREEKGEVYEFIDKQLRKEHIELSKSLQIVTVFFIERKNGRKCIVQNYRYLNE